MKPSLGKEIENIEAMRRKLALVDETGYEFGEGFVQGSGAGFKQLVEQGKAGDGQVSDEDLGKLIGIETRNALHELGVGSLLNHLDELLTALKGDLNGTDNLILAATTSLNYLNKLFDLVEIDGLSDQAKENLKDLLSNLGDSLAKLPSTIDAVKNASEKVGDASEKVGGASVKVGEASGRVQGASIAVAAASIAVIYASLSVARASNSVATAADSINDVLESINQLIDAANSITEEALTSFMARLNSALETSETLLQNIASISEQLSQALNIGSHFFGLSESQNRLAEIATAGQGARNGLATALTGLSNMFSDDSQIHSVVGRLDNIFKLTENLLGQDRQHLARNLATGAVEGATSAAWNSTGGLLARGLSNMFGSAASASGGTVFLDAQSEASELSAENNV